jgi:PhnB protein
MSTTVNPYLTFKGNCEEAFDFYKSVFGGEFDYVGRFGEMPSETPVPDSEKNKIMHVSLPISSETNIMGSDTSKAFGQVNNPGDNISLSVNASTEDEAKRIFGLLTEDGKTNMPLEKTFWGALFGMCTDKFGINWMINYAYDKK